MKAKPRAHIIVQQEKYSHETLVLRDRPSCYKRNGDLYIHKHVFTIHTHRIVTILSYLQNEFKIFKFELEIYAVR